VVSEFATGARWTGCSGCGRFLSLGAPLLVPGLASGGNWKCGCCGGHVSVEIVRRIRESFPRIAFIGFCPLCLNVTITFLDACAACCVATGYQRWGGTLERVRAWLVIPARLWRRIDWRGDVALIGGGAALSHVPGWQASPLFGQDYCALSR